MINAGIEEIIQRAPKKTISESRSGRCEALETAKMFERR
jgi:hypothetical protein